MYPSQQNSPYEYHGDKLCVKLKVLEDNEIITYDQFRGLLRRGRLSVVKEGRGAGNYVLIDFESIQRSDIKDAILQIAKPERATQSILEQYIKPDTEVFRFFSSYRKPNGQKLSDVIQKRYATNALILKAIIQFEQSLYGKYKVMGLSKTKMWQRICDAVNELPVTKYDHNIPGSIRGLQVALDKYKEKGVESIIPESVGNQNTRKLKGEIADWFLAKYALPIKQPVSLIMVEYNELRISKGWGPITEQAVLMFLNKPENKRVWMLSRHGEQEWRKHFGHKISREKDNWFPNVCWGIDGSKLDFIYQTAEGTQAKIKVNLVCDIYSEKILGYSFSLTENIVDHFTAIKMACSNASSRPYLFLYDNQSGHKSKRMQEVYSNIVAKEGGTHYPNKPYSHANPMEQLFGRIQQWCLNQEWFSDKQSIKARKADSQVNIDFIKDYAHKLPTLDQLESYFPQLIAKWNEGKHEKLAITRNVVYQSPMAQSESFDYEELCTLFWLTETKPIKYKPTGLVVKVNDVSHEFEVYTKDDLIDIEFRRKYVGERFVVKYDPQSLDTYVQLHLVDEHGSQTHIANAQPKHKHQQVPILMGETSKSDFLRDYEIRTIELDHARSEYKKLVERTGVSIEDVIENTEFKMKFGRDLTKEERSDLEGLSEAAQIVNLI
jgi:hypothetical protein